MKTAIIVAVCFIVGVAGSFVYNFKSQKPPVGQPAAEYVKEKVEALVKAPKNIQPKEVSEVEPEYEKPKWEKKQEIPVQEAPEQVAEAEEESYPVLEEKAEAPAKSVSYQKDENLSFDSLLDRQMKMAEELAD